MRDEYTSVVYIEPFSGRNRQVLGYDLWPEPERRAAAERARDSARAAITGKVRLQQESGREEQAGTIMLLPVYRCGTPPATVALRREEIAGWVFGTFRMDDLMGGLLGERAAELDIEVYDGKTTSAAALMFDGEPDRSVAAAGRGRRRLRHLAIAGHTWTLAVGSLPAFEARLASGRPEVVAAAGAGGSLLLAILIGTLVRGRRVALEAAAEVRRSEQWFRSCFHLPLVGLAVTSVEKGWIEVNDFFCALLGYSHEELDRLNWAEATHPDDLHADEIQFQRVLAGEIDVYSMEKRFLRKGGGFVWTILSVGCVRKADGQVDFLVKHVQDISLRKAAEEEVRVLNMALESRVAVRTAELVSALREMESFSYSVAHDLRAPVRAIDGYASLLAEHLGDAGDEEARGLLASVKRNSLRMGRLIDDLLDFSRTGRMELRKGPVDMTALARRVVAETFPGASMDRFEIRVAQLPPAQADVRLVEVVLRNLFANAVKFSTPGEHPVIEIGSRETDGVAEYFVRDNGVGFDQEYAHKLFGVFQRLHGMNEFEGTGIGLALVGKIVERHGGRVRAEGRVGKGATFSFTLGAP